MKNRNFITLGLTMLIITVLAFVPVEQDITFKVKVNDVNYIGQTFDGIKQTLGNSDLPSKQTFAIINSLDSVSRILRKSIQQPVDTSKKKK